MKLSEFIALPEDHKRSTVLTQGVVVAKRYQAGKTIFLYQLDDLYIETYCCVKSKEIDEYRAFQDPKHLTPYLNAINIDHLLN